MLRGSYNAPKGRDKPAQGNALGTGEFRGNSSPVGRHAANVVSPLQGECGGRAMIFLHSVFITQGVALG